MLVWPLPCAWGTRNSFSNYTQNYLQVILILLSLTLITKVHHDSWLLVFSLQKHKKCKYCSHFLRKATANSEILGCTNMKQNPVHMIHTLCLSLLIMLYHNIALFDNIALYVQLQSPFTFNSFLKDKPGYSLKIPPFCSTEDRKTLGLEQHEGE